MSVGLRALVVVESRHGATLGIAEAIADRLREHGFDVTITSPGECTVVDQPVVIVGSGIYYGRWMKAASRFLRTRADELVHRSVWLFSSGPLGDDDGDDDVGLSSEQVEQLAAIVPVRGHRLFAGRLDRSDLGPVERLITRSVHAPEGDFRDWPEIRSWADDIAAVEHARSTT